MLKRFSETSVLEKLQYKRHFCRAGFEKAKARKNAGIV
jgi:hypothetical protein